MDFDANIKRARFINDSVESHWYGSMLWDLYGVKANQVYKAWNTCVKLTWNVPRATHTFIVDNVLAPQFYSVRQQLLGRYVNFTRKLRCSQSPEVCMVFNMVARCARSTTDKNLLNIERELNLDPWITPSWRVKECVKRVEVPNSEGWRVHFLRKLLSARSEMISETEALSLLIESLCIT